jgi:hypothetical protein
VAKRDPHVVLGVEPGATATQIKAAWRRLARTHHPDLTGDDPAASRRATGRMAEINDAYAELTRAPRSGRRSGAGAGSASDTSAPPPAGGTRRGGPPRPRPTRPVTGRVDFSETMPRRNETIRPAGATRGSTLRGQPPFRSSAIDREPPRASTPTGPLTRSRIRDFRGPSLPPIDQALGLELTFGKFHGHTLGEVAGFEPSYIDWLASTITRDPELLSAARAVRDELDRQGVVRRAREAAPNRPRTA